VLQEPCRCRRHRWRGSDTQEALHSNRFVTQRDRTLNHPYFQ
jgi:hypothetical protein